MTSTYQATERLDGRVAVITGGAGAIGLRTAQLLSERGAHIALIHRRHEPERTDALLATLHGDGHRCYTASVTDSASLREAATTIERELGDASILVNSAGHTRPVPLHDLDALDDALIDDMMQVNFRGMLASIRAFLPQLRRADDAVVVNVSSIAAFTGQGSNLAYAASKAATDLATKALAKALAPDLRVVGVSPGVVNTGFVPGRGTEFNQKAAASTPLRRVGEAEDVARAILALSTSLAFTTGTTLIVDGGRHLVA